MKPHLNKTILANRLNLQPASIRLKQPNFALASLHAGAVKPALAQPVTVPTLNPVHAIKIGDVRYVDPALATAISGVRLQATGLSRDKITIPIALTEEVTDQLLFEDPQDAAQKFYLPRYRLGHELVSGLTQYRAVLEEGEQGWRLTIHLEKYAAPEIELASRQASELAHQVVVLLKYQLAGSGGIQKELVFNEVTEESAGLVATLVVNSLAERDELVRAITLPDSNADLIVRRAIKVAIPVPSAGVNDQPTIPATVDKVPRPHPLILVRPGLVRPRPRAASPGMEAAENAQPKIVSSGAGTLRGTWCFDLDSGREDTSGDMWWEQQTSTERRMVPRGGAQMTPLGAADFDAITLQQLQGLSYRAEPLDGSVTGFGPDSIMFVTQDWSPRGKAGVYNNHSLGVWFERGRDKWAIFNEDVTPMPDGAGFHVKFQKPHENAFIHRVTAANLSGHMTYLEHPLLNHNPHAILTVMQDWQPRGEGGVYNARHIGVWYDPNQQKWSIFNQGIEPMPLGAAFHVEVMPESATAFIHRVDSQNLSGHVTFLDHPSLNNHPNALVSVTQDWQPRGQGGVYNNHSIGVWDRGQGRWSIFNQDIVAMPQGAAFHIVVRQEDETCFPHVATTANINSHMTYIDRGGRPGGQLAQGNVLAVRTSNGNYAKVQVQEYGYNLNLRWVTYESEAPAANSHEVVWVDDALPAGAVPEGEGWNWVNAAPTPFSGTVAHQSSMAPNTHQHYFSSASQTLTPAAGESLFAYVYLDPVNPPSEVMLQWNDGTWEHRAYWGHNQINWGVDGTPSRHRMGDLPPAGQWVRLEVPAKLVGVEGRPLNGMAFTLFNGRATWDRAGKCRPDSAPDGKGASGPLFRETTRMLDDVQHPFMFDRGLHSYIFRNVIGGASQGPGLIRRQFQWGKAWGSYFQEQARPYIFYFLPDALKIARRPQTPHAPIMAVQFESTDGTPENMQVTLDYVAAPYVDASRIEAAAKEFRRHLPSQLPAGITDPIFEPLLADTDNVHFSVGLPRADTSKGPFQPRDGALVNIRTGLKDSLKLPLQDFETIFEAMADTTGAAILFNGEIAVNLGEGPGKINEKIPFVARMNDLVGDLFDYSEIPDEATGSVKSTFRNAIESRIRIKQLKAKLQQEGREVVAEIRELTLPVELAPGEEVQFTVAPKTPLPGTGALHVVFDLSGVEVLPDRDAIWNVIVANQRPEYSSQITVKTSPAMFVAPPHNPEDQLVEIDVQFNRGATVELTAEKREAKATVWFPISDIILRKESTMEYRFRVTAVRHSGVVVGDWITSTNLPCWITNKELPPAR